jgi:hypothetical protein
VRRLLITAVLGALIASGLTASPATADAWVDAPDVTGTGDDIADLVIGAYDPICVDAATNRIRTATLQDDKSWSAPRTIAQPSGPPTLVTASTNLWSGVMYTVGSSLFVIDASGATRTLSTSVVPGTVSSGSDTVLWAETVAGGLERIMDFGGGGAPSELRAPAATHYFSLSSTVTEPKPDRPLLTLGWVAGPDASGARAWTQDAGRAPVQVSTAPTRSIGFVSGRDTLVTWTQDGPSGTSLYAAERTGQGAPWKAAVALSAGSPVPGASVSDVTVLRTADQSRFVTRVSWREDGTGGWAVRDATLTDGTWSWAKRTLDSGTGTLGSGAFVVTANATAWCAPLGAGCEVRATRPGAATYVVLGTSADPDVRLALSYIYYRGTGSDLLVWSDGSDVRAAALDFNVNVSDLSWSLPGLTLTGRATARWSVGDDDWSAAAPYLVRATDWGPRAAPRSLKADLKVLDPASTSTSRTIRVRDGHTRCVQVGARDTAGNAAGLAVSCVAAPLDDRALHRSKGWTKVRDRGSFHHTLLRTTRRGATLGFTPAGFTDYSIVFRRTPGAGKVVLQSGAWHSKVINLAGSSARRVVVHVRGWHLKPARIRVVSHGKPVLIDGLAAVPVAGVR